MKILTIDDQPIASRVLHASICSIGHEPQVANDPQVAWDLLVSDEFRIVVSDWKMPGMDGLELCRRIRARGGAYVYFILVSSQAITKEAQKAAYAAGVDDFLRKPLDPEELSMKLHVATRILGMTDKLLRLEGFVPTCRACHSMRSDSEFWQEVESMVHRHRTDGDILDQCPDCRRQGSRG